MDPKISETVKNFQPTIEYVYKNVPEGFSKDMALSKCQESIWWALKAYDDDANLKKGTPVEAKKD
jgi:hypothetical protein